MSMLLLAAARRLRVALWPITQTSMAAGVAWYLAHDLLHHPQPFFAPISATVCMSASNVLRARRAMQMMVGVALGIVLGAGVQALLGTRVAAFGVAVLVALSVAVLIGRGFIAEGLMFVNQTAVSSILVLVFAHSGSVVAERLFDALIGGGLALLFSVVLFPANPVTLLADARAAVLSALTHTLNEIAKTIKEPARVPADWPLSCADQLHNQLGALSGTRSTAALVARHSPLRRGMRDAIANIDRQAARLGLLATGVLELARSISPPLPDRLAAPLYAAVCDLVKATAAADSDSATACAGVASASVHVSTLQSAARQNSDVVLAAVLQSCVDDLQNVIDCR